MHKVLVGCPTSSYKEYCLKEYANSVKSLTYPNYDVLLVDNSPDKGYVERIKKLSVPVVRCSGHKAIRERIVASRNILRKKVLDENYDYFLSLEQDVIPPNDIIEKLIGYDKKIISAVYFTYNIKNDVTKLVPVLYKKIRGMSILQNLSIEEIDPPRLIKIEACGLGCVLIHKDVLRKINFKYDKGFRAFDDIHFSRDASIQGFEIFADTGVRCKHLIKNWNWLNLKEEI